MTPRTREALMTAATLLGVFGLVTLGSKKPARAAVRLTPERRRRVALIGDSYAVGLGPELVKLLPDFHYEGHAGIGVADWLHHGALCMKQRGAWYDSPQTGCGDWISGYQPDFVFVSLGVNPSGAIPNPADYQAVVRALTGLGARVIWIEPPASVPTAVRGTIAQLGVPTVPATHVPTDGLHPLAGGYSTWAREVAAIVNAEVARA